MKLQNTFRSKPAFNNILSPGRGKESPKNELRQSKEQNKSNQKIQHLPTKSVQHKAPSISQGNNNSQNRNQKFQRCFSDPEISHQVIDTEGGQNIPNKNLPEQTNLLPINNMLQSPSQLKMRSNQTKIVSNINHIQISQSIKGAQPIQKQQITSSIDTNQNQETIAHSYTSQNNESPLKALPINRLQQQSTFSPQKLIQDQIIQEDDDYSNENKTVVARSNCSSAISIHQNKSLPRAQASLVKLRTLPPQINIENYYSNKMSVNYLRQSHQMKQHDESQQYNNSSGDDTIIKGEKNGPFIDQSLKLVHDKQIIYSNTSIRESQANFSKMKDEEEKLSDFFGTDRNNKNYLSNQNVNSLPQMSNFNRLYGNNNKLNQLRIDSQDSSLFNENADTKHDLDRNHTKSQNRVIEVIEQEGLLSPTQAIVTTQDLRSQPQPSTFNLIVELNLRLANLKELSSVIFQQNPYIKQIDCRNNKITIIPENICDLQYLWKMKVDYNYLEGLPDKLGEITKLEYISASQNKLNQIPFSLFRKHSNLQVLVFNDNRIKSISPEIQNLQSLKQLYLHNNLISQLPMSMYKLKQLSEYSLDWITYQDSEKNLSRILKDQQGMIIIKEFLEFFKLFYKNNQSIYQSEQFIHFTHYLMYFQRIKSIIEIQDISYRPKKRSLIHQLALNGHLYLLQDILQYCEFLDVNKEDAEGTSAFVLAIKNKRIDFVKFLLNFSQTNINKPSLKYGHPLQLAIQTHEFKLALKFLKNQSNTANYKFIDINCKNEEGNNCLHYLFMSFYANQQLCSLIAKQLIKKGISINYKNKSDWTPLQIAVMNNQYDAIQYALDHNAYLRQLQFNKDNKTILSQAELKSKLFDFNLQGGKMYQTILHLVIQSNNLKMINLLLQSQEKLNFQALDKEGKSPRDICPYNSPVFKLILKYEKKIIHQDFDHIYYGNPHREIDIVHFYVSKRNYESPTIIREKILQRAQEQQQKQQLTNSQMRQKPKHAQTIRDRSHTVGKNSSLNQNFNSESSLSPLKPGGRVRMFSANTRDSQQNQIKTFHNKKEQKQLQNESSCIVDDYDHHNEDFQTPMASGYHSAKFSTISNQNQNNGNNQILHNSTFTPIQLQTSPVSQKQKQIKDQKKQQFQIKSDVSSPNESMLTHKGSLPQKSGNNVKETQSSRTDEYGMDVEPFQYNSASSKVRAHDVQVKSVKRRGESVVKERGIEDDEEEDANVPEDDNEHVNQQNLDRDGSPCRVLRKNQSMCSIHQSSEKQNIVLLSAIINELSEQRNHLQAQGNKTNQFKMVNHSTIQSENLISPRMKPQEITRSEPIGGGNNQEQGNEGDISLLNANKDDSVYIPQDEHFGAKFATNSFKKINDLKGRLNDETSPTDTFFHQSHGEKIYLLYQEMFLGLSKQKLSHFSAQRTEIFFQTSNNCLKSIFLADQCYYLTMIMNLSEIKNMIQQTSILLQGYKDKSISKRIQDFVFYDLINNHEQKIIQQKKTLQMQMMILDQQTLKGSQIQKSSFLSNNSKLIIAPILKVQLKKSPSLLVVNQEIATTQTMESPVKRSFVETSIIQPLIYRQNLVHLEKSAKTENRSDIRNSLKQHREDLFHQIQQPFQTQKVQAVKAKQEAVQMQNEIFKVKVQSAPKTMDTKYDKHNKIVVVKKMTKEMNVQAMKKEKNQKFIETISQSAVRNRIELSEQKSQTKIKMIKSGTPIAKGHSIGILSSAKHHGKHIEQSEKKVQKNNYFDYLIDLELGIQNKLDQSQQKSSRNLSKHTGRTENHFSKEQLLYPEERDIQKRIESPMSSRQIGHKLQNKNDKKSQLKQTHISKMQLMQKRAVSIKNAFREAPIVASVNDSESNLHSYSSNSLTQQEITLTPSHKRNKSPMQQVIIDGSKQKLRLIHHMNETPKLPEKRKASAENLQKYKGGVIKSQEFKIISKHNFEKSGSQRKLKNKNL